MEMTINSLRTRENFFYAFVSEISHWLTVGESAHPLKMNFS